MIFVRFAVVIAVLGLMAFALFWQPAHAAGRPCYYLSSADAYEAAARGAQAHGGTAEELDGKEAARFLDFYNTKIGEPTDFVAESILISRRPSEQTVYIAFVIKGCIMGPFKLDLPVFQRAYVASVGWPT